MTAIPGVQIKKNVKGKTTHVEIDLRKHPEAVGVLKEAGLLPKTDFEKDFERGVPVAEVKEHILQKIKDHYAKRSNQ